MPTKPKSLMYYADIARGGKYCVNLTKAEAAMILKVYDFGADSLTDDELTIFNSAIAKLKEKIHP